MTTEPLVELRGVSVRHGGEHILDGVDLSVLPGHAVTIVGPNGSGKTTLLRVTLGLVTPDQGTVRRRAGLRVGYVPQRLTLEATLPLTVGRFLSLAVAGRVGRERLLAALETVRAGHVVDRQVHDVSGGEMQRLLLARALLREPQLLVLDEPVAGVDIAGQAEVYDLIARYRRENGCGVLMVSHDLHIVMAATDHVVCLNRHVCCAGTPQAVSRDPAYAAMFGEGIAGSLAVYTHRHDHVHDWDGRPHPVAETGGDD